MTLKNIEMQQELNRAKTLWQNWEQLEKSINQLGSIGLEHPLELARQKYDFLREGLYRLEDHPVALEKPHLALIRAVCHKLEKQLYPGRLFRLLHQMKTLFYDKPRVAAAHQLMVEQNLGELKAMFQRRGLHELASKLDEPLDYEKQQQSFEVYSPLDKYRSVSLTPVLEKDGLGCYQLREIKAHFYGTDPMNGVDLVIPEAYQLNRVQILNLLQDRPVYVHGDLYEGAQGRWLQLEYGREPGQFGIYTFESATGFDLAKALAEFAGETGLYRAAASDVVQELQLGNTFRMSGQHPRDQPFLIHADPSRRSICFTDLQGTALDKDYLFESLKHHTPEPSKVVQGNLLLDKHKSIDPGQQKSL